VFHPRNVRRDLGDVRELAASIAQGRVLQPLLVERRTGTEVLRVWPGTGGCRPPAWPGCGTCRVC